MCTCMDGLDDVEFAWIKKEEKDTSETPKAKKRDGFTFLNGNYWCVYIWCIVG